MSNYDKALDHWRISCGRGHNASLTNIKDLFIQEGYATKEDYGEGSTIIPTIH